MSEIRYAYNQLPHLDTQCPYCENGQVEIEYAGANREQPSHYDEECDECNGTGRIYATEAIAEGNHKVGDIFLNEAYNWVEIIAIEEDFDEGEYFVTLKHI